MKTFAKALGIALLTLVVFIAFVVLTPVAVVAYKKWQSKRKGVQHDNHSYNQAG